jgi:hypothetical protein
LTACDYVYLPFKGKKKGEIPRVNLYYTSEQVVPFCVAHLSENRQFSVQFKWAEAFLFASAGEKRG